MNRNLLLAAVILLLPACAGNRREIRLTSEPSIERAFDLITATKQGRPLMKFLYRHPVLFEYSNAAGLCHKFNLERGLILLPEEMRGSDLVLAMTVARAAYIYRLYLLTGLEEIVSEEEELGALYQAKLGVEIGLTEEDFNKSKGSAGLKEDFCTYIMDGSGSAMAKARMRVLSQDPDCQHPLDTMGGQKIWLEKMRQAMNESNFHHLLYERDKMRVQRGVMTASEAMKRDARTRAMPAYEAYRYQRTFFDVQSGIFSGFEKTWKDEIAADEAWRAANKEELDRARHEFSTCNMKD